MSRKAICCVQNYTVTEWSVITDNFQRKRCIGSD